jgi:ATP-dependent DNA helicase RecQ
MNNQATIPQPADINQVLQHYWGYSEFRPLQKEAVDSVLQNRDSIVVLPTGGGKSICYQSPAVLMPGMAIVISPLISLMKDQVDALHECGIAAARLDSTLHPMEINMVFDDIHHGRLKLLYISPERLFSGGFMDTVKKMNLSFIAVDEAHCVSMWGHDFRPEYRQLGRLKEMFPTLPIHAYTATATQMVRDDIAKQLHLKQPEILVGSFDRPNLIYKIERRSGILEQVIEVINRHPKESGVIYCIRRKDVEGICSELTNNGFSALPYHAGMNDHERKSNQDAFIKEKVDIIVATVAFGMGIDKSNVRYVIHTGMPKSLENYQQESGRAGRDGLEAECCLFYSGGDFGTWKSIMRSTPDDAKKVAEQKLSEMYDFCTGVICRHKAIIQYFGQTLEKENCKACDVCLGDMDYVKDALVIAQKILSCIKRVNENFGSGYIASVLTGSKEQRILSNQHDELTTYGILAEHPKTVVHDWTEQLVSQGYAEKSGEFNVVRVTPKGWNVLKGIETPNLIQPMAKKSSSKLKGTLNDAWEGVDSGLFDELRQRRKEIADQKEVPAFVVFSDATLRDMARIRPTTTKAFLLVSGVGDKKNKEYGKQFTAYIQHYCQSHSLQTDRIDETVPNSPNQKQSTQTQASPNTAKNDAMEAFKKGVAIDTIAKSINRATCTVHTYLFEYLKQEKITDSSPWVDEPTQQKIIRAASASASEDGRLKPIFEALNKEVTYEDIRITLTCYQNLNG